MAAGRRILIADDDEPLRLVLADFFGGEGFEVFTASNGLEALLYLKRFRPSAMLLDLMMPRLGGLDALKHIQQFDPEVRVVVLTGFLDTDLHERALAAGASAVVVKPVDMKALLACFLAEDPRASAPAPVAAPESMPAPEVRVLVIDDDPHVSEPVVEYLKLGGLSARSADDGASGLRLALSYKPDVVVLDLHMPALRGIDALVALRAAAPDVKVIVMSGTDDEGLIQRALSYGAFAFFRKPADLSKLRETVERAAKAKALETP